MSMSVELGREELERAGAAMGRLGDVTGHGAEESDEARRKREQRERDAASGVVEITTRLGAGEAAMLAESRELRAFGGNPYTTTEYINSLIRRDHELLKQQQGIVADRICERCRKQLPRGCGGVWKGELPCALKAYGWVMAL